MPPDIVRGKAGLELRAVSKFFGDFAALKGVNLGLHPGDSILLYGPNGAGKTTLLRILGALARPSEGQVLFDGEDLHKNPAAAKAEIGFVSHATFLYGELTARENLKFVGTLFGLLDLAKKIDAAMELFGLQGPADVPVRELSRGFQQRVSLARSCLHDPSFLLLDEPFTGLDRETTENLSALLRRLPELGKTVVFSTHDFEQGSAIAERLVAVERGSVRYDGPLSLAPLDALGIAARKAEHSKRKTEDVGAGLTPRQSGPLTPARSPGAERVAEDRVSGYRSRGGQTTPFLLMRNLRVVWAIFVKDLTIEWRHRETLPAMCVFGLLVVFLFNFAFEPAREESLRLLPGLLWIAFAFAGILGFNRSFAAERENGCLDGLSLAPIDPGAIYLGKMIANVVFLGIAEAVVVFAASLWYNFSFVPFLRWFSFIVLLGTLGFTALGTIFGAIAANTRMREVMLPVLQFPVAFWVLILAIDATSGALRGESASGIAAGVKLLAGVSAVFWIASFLLFEYVLEE